MHAPWTTPVCVRKRVSAGLNFHQRLVTRRKEHGPDEHTRVLFADGRP